MQQRDEENKYLGNPAEMPKLTPQEGKEPIWNLFLRLPKGISEKPQAALFGEMLAEYPAASGDFVNLYLCVTRDQKDFPKEVLQLFPPVGEVRNENITLSTIERQIPLSRYTFDDGQTTLSVNIFQEGKRQVAVVYRVKRGGLSPQNVKSSELRKTIDLSLQTLGVDVEAAKMRAAFDKFHKKG